MFENCVFRANEVLGGIIGFVSLQQTTIYGSNGSIYRKGKGRRQFYDGPLSRERQLMLDLLLV